MRTVKLSVLTGATVKTVEAGKGTYVTTVALWSGKPVHEPVIVALRSDEATARAAHEEAVQPYRVWRKTGRAIG